MKDDVVNTTSAAYQTGSVAPVLGTVAEKSVAAASMLGALGVSLSTKLWSAYTDSTQRQAPPANSPQVRLHEEKKEADQEINELLKPEPKRE